MYICLCSCENTCAHQCGSQRITSSVAPQVLDTFLKRIIFLDILHLFHCYIIPSIRQHYFRELFNNTVLKRRAKRKDPMLRINIKSCTQILLHLCQCRRIKCDTMSSRSNSSYHLSVSYCVFFFYMCYVI